MLIFHVDVNSAYLSWTAAALLEKGYKTDLRTIPAVIAGDPENRHGIILAKSIPAKKYGIRTGQSLYEAKQNCPHLAVYPADYDLFLLCSDALYQILQEYTPLIQRYSVDECFMDCSRLEAMRKDPVRAAYEIKERVKRELGFTVNIGIAENKVMAKMAGELKKPDMIHTLWPCEMEDKLWPLLVDELFMVGKATAKKLHRINIHTIGELARANVLLLKSILKSHGQLIYDYANGVDLSPVVINEDIVQKGLGNSMTMPFNAETRDMVMQQTLALCERVGMRLRKRKRRASLIAVHLKADSFVSYRHQVQLQSYINTTREIYEIARQLIDQCWRGEPLRKIGVSVSKFAGEEEVQMSLFDRVDQEKQEQLEQAVDEIRSRYGDRSIIRASFANTGIEPIQGGVNDGRYIMMGGYEQ